MPLREGTEVQELKLKQFLKDKSQIQNGAVASFAFGI
jgi:hypothetical protein